MAEEYIVNAKFNTGDAVKGAQKLGDALEDVNETVEDTSQKANELGDSLDKVSGGAVSRFKGLRDSVKSVSKSFFTLKGAIAATGLGLLLMAIQSIRLAFTNSEEGQNRYAKLLGVIGSVVGNLTDRLAAFGELVLTDPFGALEAVFQNIFNRIKGVVMLIPELVNSLALVFEGKFEEAGQKASDAFLVIATGVEGATEKLKEFTKEVEKEAKQAAAIADQRAKADKLDRELLVERQKENVKINELKTKAAEVDKFTTEERIAFLQEAAKLENDITNKEIEAARLRFEAKKEENSLNASTKEDLQEQAELEARLIQLESEKLVRTKEVLGVASGLRKMEADKRAAEAQAEIDRENARQDSILTIQKDFIKKREDLAATTELEKLALEQERTLAELDRLGATEQQKLDIIAFYADQEKQIKNTLQDEENARLEADKEAKRNKVMGDLDLITSAAGQENAIGRAAFIAKQGLLLKEQIIEAKASLQKLGLIAAESTAAQAAGAANTAKIGFPQNIPMLIAFAAQAVGIIATVKSAVNAAKQKASAMGGGGGSVGTIQAPRISASTSAPSQPAAFNVVGASETSQLAQTINAQSNRPIKTYVTSSDVTSAQSLDRNIIETASI